jgi:hypothetical protein
MPKNHNRKSNQSNRRQRPLFSEAEIRDGLRHSFRANVIMCEDLEKPRTPEQQRAVAIADLALGKFFNLRDGSRLVPAVKFILDATFHVLEQPRVAARFENIKEVGARSMLGGLCSELVTSVAFGEELFDAQYTETVLRRTKETYGDFSRSEAELAKYSLDGLGDGRRLAKLGSVTFLDHMIVAGGALRALHNADIYDDDATAIIERSPIHDTAGIGGERLTLQARNYLRVPYANPSNYVISKDKDDKTILRFSDETSRYLHDLYQPASGCPARNMHPQAGGPSLLEQEWGRFTRYAVPSSATVDVAEISEPLTSDGDRPTPYEVQRAFGYPLNNLER